MAREVAAKLLADRLSDLRKESYESLVERLKAKPSTEAILVEGTQYQFEVGVFWDSKQGGDLRVRGMIDGGDISAWTPMCDDFIMRPDGTFVGE